MTALGAKQVALDSTRRGLQRANGIPEDCLGQIVDFHCHRSLFVFVLDVSHLTPRQMERLSTSRNTHLIEAAIGARKQIDNGVMIVRRVYDSRR